jgi:NADPH-dependent 2,4-dienoyl-CoA reductase/sulfur reductase-like enzyme
VERNGEIGPDLGQGPRPVITEALTELGVTWKLGSGVSSVDANGVTLESEERIDANTVIWTAGARASGRPRGRARGRGNGVDATPPVAPAAAVASPEPSDADDSASVHSSEFPLGITETESD